MGELMNKDNLMAFDIETVKNSKADEYYKQKKYYAPSNYKDEKKKEAYIDQEMHKDKSKAALTWWTGKVICICSWNQKDGKKGWHGDDEQKLLEDFFSYLNLNPHLTLVGKSSKDFDIPFLVGRALALNIPTPTQLRTNMWKDLVDVDEMFSFSRQCGQVSSLNNYAWGLGIDPKTGSGRDVADMYTSTLIEPEEWNKIEDYCHNDVRIVQEMLNRYYQPIANPKQVELFGIKNDELPC